MKIQYSLTFSQIHAITLLAHMFGTFLSEDVNDRKLMVYDITADQKSMLDTLFNQEGVVVKDKLQWPSKGDGYYYIDDEGYILYSKWNCPNDDLLYIDINRRNIGNVFKTKEEAQFVSEKLEVLNRLKSLSDDDQKWNNENIHYQIVYTYNHVFDVWPYIYAQIPHEYWFKSEESAKAAIKTIGEDKLKKYIFNIKEN